METVTAIVTSKDGASFAVLTDKRAVPFEQAFAAKFDAAELETHGDFLRVDGPASLTDAAPQVTELTRVAELVTPAGAPEALVRAQKRWGNAQFIWGDVDTFTDTP